MAQANLADERIQALQVSTSDALAELEREVSESRGAVQSVLTFIAGLKQQLEDALNSGDITPRIVAITRELESHQQSIADAVRANPANDEQEQPVEEPEDDSGLSNDATREPSNGNPVHGVDDSDLRPRP